MANNNSNEYVVKQQTSSMINDNERRHQTFTTENEQFTNHEFFYSICISLLNLIGVVGCFLCVLVFTRKNLLLQRFNL